MNTSLDIDLFILTIECVSGYLRYKTITFQNVSSEAQFKNFSFYRKVMLRSQDIQPVLFLTIP